MCAVRLPLLLVLRAVMCGGATGGASSSKCSLSVGMLMACHNAGGCCSVKQMMYGGDMVNVSGCLKDKEQCQAIKEGRSGTNAAIRVGRDFLTATRAGKALLAIRNDLFVNPLWCKEKPYVAWCRANLAKCREQHGCPQLNYRRHDFYGNPKPFCRDNGACSTHAPTPHHSWAPTRHPTPDPTPVPTPPSPAPTPLPTPWPTRAPTPAPPTPAPTWGPTRHPTPPPLGKWNLAIGGDHALLWNEADLRNDVCSRVWKATSHELHEILRHACPRNDVFDCTACGKSQRDIIHARCESKHIKRACAAVVAAHRTALDRERRRAIYIQPEFMPLSGFVTARGEMGACLLGKAEALGEMLFAMAECGHYSSARGQSDCYDGTGDDLVKDVRQCCFGNDVLVVGKTDQRLCKRLVLSIVAPIRQHVTPVWDKCVANPSSCTYVASSAFGKVVHDCDVKGWRSPSCVGHFFHTVGLPLVRALQAAEKLFERARPGETTKAAAKLLKMCRYHELGICKQQGRPEIECIMRVEESHECVHKFFKFEKSKATANGDRYDQ